MSKQNQKIAIILTWIGGILAGGMHPYWYIAWPLTLAIGLFWLVVWIKEQGE